jgi:hypothetical protein
MFAILFDTGISISIKIDISAGMARSGLIVPFAYAMRPDADFEVTILRRVETGRRGDPPLPRTCVFIARDSGFKISVSSCSRSARKEWFLKCLDQHGPAEYAITPPQRISPNNHLEKLKRAEQEMNHATIAYEATLKRVRRELDDARLSYEDAIKRIRRERFAPKSIAPKSIAPKSRQVRTSAAICRAKYSSLNDGSEKSVVVGDTDLRTLDDRAWVNDVIISYFIYEFIPPIADMLPILRELEDVQGIARR